MDAAINDIADNGPPQIAWDSIAPTIEQNNNNSTENDIVTIDNIDIMCNSDYCKHLRNLNDGQCIMSNRLWCKTYVCKLCEGKVHKGYTWYLGGPGGVGKSHVIQLIR